jgi:protein-disulfide isomerase
MTQAATPRGHGWRGWLDALVAVVLLAAGSVVLVRTFHRTPVRQPPPIPSEVQEIAWNAAKGSREAPVALIVYSEFQCPYCAQFARVVMPELEERYVEPGRLLVVFRHFPLPHHAEAMPAASVAACAGDAFWQAHDALFSNRLSLPGADVPSIIELAGLRGGAIRSCADGLGRQRVRADMASARRLQITSTPTFFAGLRVAGGVKVERVISGAKPLAEFTEVIDDLLSRK